MHSLSQFRQNNPIGLGTVPDRLLAAGQRWRRLSGSCLFRQRVELSISLRSMLFVPLKDRLAHYFTHTKRCDEGF
jgi:hypothetical protein